MIIFKPVNVATEQEIVKVRFTVEGQNEDAVRLVHDHIVRMVTEINTSVASSSVKQKRCSGGPTDVHDDAT